MLVRFAILPDALEQGSESISQLRAMHERVIEVWDRFGVLVPRPERQRELLERIDALPQVVRSLWHRALRRSMARGLRSVDLSSQVSLADINGPNELSALAGQIDTLCVDEVRALEMGMPEDAASSEVRGLHFEVARIGEFDRSERVCAARILAEARIPVRTAVEALWRERFELLVRTTRRMVVVDRYAWTRHDGLRVGESGLRRFIQLCSKTGGRIRMLLVTAADGDSFERIHSFGDAALQGGIVELCIVCMADSRFGSISHGRHLRFDQSIMTLDVGVELFERAHVGRDIQFSFRPCRDSDEALEKRLCEAGVVVFNRPR